MFYSIQFFLFFSNLVFAFMVPYDVAEKEVQIAEFESKKISRETTLKEGEKIYFKARCHSCHGTYSQGQIRSRRSLAFGANDFTESYKFRSTPTGHIPTDTDLWRSISEGISNSKMPSYSHLSTQSRFQVIQYLKSLSPRFRGGSLPEPMPIGLPPTKNISDIQSGRNWYLLLHCFDCHGTLGLGDGSRGTTLKDDIGRRVAPTNLKKGKFKSGSFPEDIYRTLLTGLDGSPMKHVGSDSFLFDRETFRVKSAEKDEYPLLSQLKGLSKTELSSLKILIDGLPSQVEILKMNPKSRDRTATLRRWQLVYYVLSLSEKKKVAKEKKRWKRR